MVFRSYWSREPWSETTCCVLKAVQNPFSMRTRWRTTKPRRARSTPASCMAPEGQHGTEWSTLAEGKNAWQMTVEPRDVVCGIAPVRLFRRRSGEAGDFREKRVSQYERSSGATLSENVRIGMVMNRVTDPEMATQFLPGRH